MAAKTVERLMDKSFNGWTEWTTPGSTDQL